MHVDAACKCRLQVNTLRMGSQGDPQVKLRMPFWQRSCGLSVVSLQVRRKAMGNNTIKKSPKARDEADSFTMQCCHVREVFQGSSSPLEATVYGTNTSCEILV